MRKVFTAILCLFVLAGSVMPQKSIPVYALESPYADSIEDSSETLDAEVDYPSTSDIDFDYSQIDLTGELISERTGNTKTFLRADGSYVVAIYDDAVHYEKDGEFLDIDNSMSFDKSKDEYSNYANKFTINFPNKLDENKKINLSLEDYSVMWRVLSTNKASINIADSKVKTYNNKELTNISQAVSYPNIMSGVDLHYQINGSNVKEDIVLTKYIKDFSISFEYTLKNLTLVDEDGYIKFVNQIGETIFDFADLYAIDQSGSITDKIKLSIIEIKNDTYQVSLSLDDEWAENAKYPVTIDPTINSSTQGMTYYDTYVSEASPTTNYLYSTILNISSVSYTSEYRGLMYFYLPSVVMDKEITYATYSVTASSKTLGRTIALYKNLANFTAGSVTWNTKPSATSTMTDFHIVDTSNTYVFNITKTVREWQATGNTRTSGFTIKDKSNYGAYNSVYSEEYSDTTKVPVIEIGYIDPAGIKDYWTYNSQQVSEHSTGYVSDLTGLLNVVRNDLSFSTERQNLSLSFGYNIMERSTNYGYYKGWNIVYNTYVKQDTSLNLFYTQDYTGNKVYYHLTTCDSRINPTSPEVDVCYLAEDGSGNILVRQYAYGYLGGQYLLTTGNIKQVFNTSGYLTSIVNTENNQSVTVTRDGTYLNRVTKIRDSAGNEIRLTYTGEYMTKAGLYLYQDALNSRLVEEVNYSYSLKTDGSGEYVLDISYSKNYDDSQSMAVDETLHYDYDTYGRIMAHYLDGQDLIEYLYNTTTNKVINIKSYYNGNQFSQINYTYSLRETTLTDQKGDFVIYKFDGFGHTINILDSDGNVQYYKYLNIFSTSDALEVDYLVLDGVPNYKRNHNLISQSNPQSNLFNPINNHGFEYDSSNMDVGWVYHDDNGELRELDKDDHSDDNRLYGNYSAMINASSLDNGHYEQTVLLDEGAYTLTGYVWNQASNSNVWIDIIGEDYGGAITYVTNNSEWTKVTITFGVYGANNAVTVSLVNHSIGKSYFDNIEIYEGFIDNRTNMIDNASFEMTGTIDLVPGWFFSNSSYVYRSYIESGLDDLHESILGDYALRIDGSGTLNRSAFTGISDFLDTTILDEKGQLIIGSWAKSMGTPTTITSNDYIDGNERYFRIRVDFVSTVTYVYGPDYANTIIKSEYVDFDTSVEGWQYQYAKMTMPDVNTYWINVFLEYKGEGSVYFDGLQIFYENSYTNYEYDEYGNLTAIQTSGGDRTEYTYDTSKDYASTPTDIDLPDGTNIGLSENTNSLIDEVTYNNVASTPTYNSNGQVTSMRIGDATTYFSTSTTYTHLSQYTATTTDEFNNTTDYFNDALTGLLEAIENAKGQDTHYIYDNEGKLIRVVSVENYLNYTTGGEDALVEYMYDTFDRLWKIVLDDDYYYEISYDPQGRIEEIAVNTTPLMNYSYEMDGSYYTGRLSEQTYGNGDALKFTYNDKDQIETLQFKEYGGAFVTKFSYEYDDYGQIAVYNTYESGVIVASEYYTYDSSGNLIQAVDEAGNIIKYIYDDSGNLTSLYFDIEGYSSTTNYSYNECFEYSGDTCVQTSSLYDNTEYHTQSNIDVLKDYHYEEFGLYRLGYINLIWSTFNIKQNFIYSGNTTRISQITYEINGTGVDYKYTYYYDSLGNISKEYYYEGTALKIYRNYEYDALNQLVVEDSRDYDYPSSTLSATNFTNYYYYDSRGNRTDVKTFLYGQNDITNPTIPSFYQFNNGSNDAVMYYNYSYDYQDMYYLNIGQTPSLSFMYFDIWDTYQEYPITAMATTLVYSNLNTSVAGYYYSTYQATDNSYYNLTFRIVFKVGNPQPYNTVPQKHLHYNYSSNWEDQLLSYGQIDYVNGVPQTEATVQQYTYDNQGNPTAITNFIYDGTTYHHALLSWSGRELTNIFVMSSSGYPIYQIAYTYNDQGYRIEKEFSTFNGSGFTINQTIKYELIDDKVIFETDGIFGIMYTYDYDGTLISFNYDSDIHDAYVGSEYFYIRNQMGDITHISNSSGVVVVHYLYDAYGNILDIDYASGYAAIAEANPYRYRGYRYDSEIGMYYLNSRYYNPEVGRFINSDGLLGQQGNILSTNMYAYCANNPVMLIDESGFKWNIFEIFGAVALGVAIVATVAIVITCPASLPLLAIAGNAAASGIGQVVSNVLNGNPVCQNVLGATVGGAISGLSYFGGGVFAELGGGIINAGINELENSCRENRDFNVVDFAYESFLYSTLNIITKTPKNASLNQLITGVYSAGYIMASGYTISDGGIKDVVTDFIDQIIDSVKTRVEQWR
jgi:RHS repeat-associated protein